MSFIGKLVTNDIILSILTACPWIREVVVGEPNTISHPSLLASPAVHALDSLKVWPFEYRFYPSKYSTGRCCDVVIRRRANMYILCTLAVAIRGLDCADYGIGFFADSLSMLADTHGLTLERCNLLLGDDVNTAEMEYFLSRCPNMVELSLTPHGDKRALIDNACLRSLPLWCPRIPNWSC